MPEPDRRPRLVLRPCRALVAGLSAVLLLGTALALATASPESPRPTMHLAFKALAGLVPIALSASSDNWQAQQATVSRAVATLSAASEQLAVHGRNRDATFRFMSDSLGAKVRMLEWQVNQKDFEGATFATMSLADTCVGCHLRLPNPRDRDFAKTLLKDIDPASLDPFDRANLEAAGRQFTAALSTYENEFAAADTPIESAEFANALESYLIVALRVQRDPARAERGLAILGRQPDLAAQFQRNLGIWRQALRDLAPALREPASLERAREILDSGRLLSEFPLDAADEIHSIVASSMIFRYLEDRQPAGEELARALYLLARTEAFAQQSFEISDALVYLEQAIRAAPHTDIADRAYARLELQTILEYSGPLGLEIPDEVNAWLLELRELSTSRPRSTSSGEQRNG
jgi:hypothetical protein